MVLRVLRDTAYDGVGKLLMRGIGETYLSLRKVLKEALLAGVLLAHHVHIVISNLVEDANRVLG